MLSAGITKVAHLQLALFSFLFLVGLQGELSTHRQMMKVPSEPGSLHFSYSNHSCMH